MADGYVHINPISPMYPNVTTICSSGPICCCFFPGNPWNLSMEKPWPLAGHDYPARLLATGLLGFGLRAHSEVWFSIHAVARHQRAKPRSRGPAPCIYTLVLFKAVQSVQLIQESTVSIYLYLYLYTYIYIYIYTIFLSPSLSLFISISIYAYGYRSLILMEHNVLA